MADMADMAGGAPAPGVDGLDGDKIDRPSSHGTTTSIRRTSTGHGAMGPWGHGMTRRIRRTAMLRTEGVVDVVGFAWSRTQVAWGKMVGNWTET